VGRRGPREEKINNTTHHESCANANPIINHPPKPNICPSPLVQIIEGKDLKGGLIGYLAFVTKVHFDHFANLYL
jgi:hypothetical protein